MIKPKISIITPTYNSELTVQKTLESIVAQSYDEIEHIIVDGKSSDSTIDIINNFYQKSGFTNFILRTEKDKGISDAFNKGIALASGEIIGFLNSDDYLMNEKVISKIAEEFELDEWDFVHGDIYFEDSRFGSNIRRPLQCSPKMAMPFNHPTFYVKKEIFEDIGYFDLENRTCMDYEWIMRLYKNNNEMNYRGHYLSRFGPMVYMRAGGISWNQEIKGIKESREALAKHGLIDFESRKSLQLRLLRIKMRNLLENFGMSYFIKLWRSFKWN